MAIFKSLQQRTQHFLDFNYLVLKLAELGITKRSKIVSQKELIFQFAGGSQRYLDEAAHL